ncbi:FadR/GntR family transcriptional regulator [Mesorhizobium amorphae]|uniref:GntR family transcriptional regulator n=1 Tax=Mesorhizobium amorphae CCNWGS0123 TaxID=1082933 RepID=G6YLL8_9HYPH|nr:FadR/GntR family transcriptional regulator [Mesorhizobium amorphae]ANT52771.1 GntR family transcriptional regulator [Mesorhizobium amorphae CCNWGS0123]EHH02613.1 GntR family transcriptional regulator [Mesorhizobium amorphae CCNWGS0123]GLR45358.1 GntR family transcriptional regulator [Mesorhizobium amorphae]
MTKRKPLSTVVAESLSEKIRSGRLQPGAQLPTEAELCAEYDVSRTVVREAVARLRSEGMVIPQQGRGMFVSEAPAPRNFSIPQDALKTLPETVSLLELRLSVEVEAAGLCAERRTESEASTIRRLMEQVDARNEDPGAVPVHYDYDFHLAIAKSARNEFIHGFLEYLRPVIVPRFQLGHVVVPELKDAYYARIHSEHRKIVEAIEKQDGRAARDAMRKHLQNSLERVRALALASGVETTDAAQKAAAASLFSDLKGSAAPTG